MRRCLIVDTGIVHPSLAARRALREALAGCADFELLRTSSIEDVTEHAPSALDAIVVYLHRREISDDALDAIDGFVRTGGGLLGVHAATASFKTRDAWFRLLGGRFVGHGPVHRFTVEPAAETPDAIFGEIEPFSVRDELYHHRIEAELRTHLQAEGHPVLWTRQHGQGRVACFALGHRAAALRHPTSVRILQQAIDWVGQRRS